LDAAEVEIKQLIQLRVAIAVVGVGEIHRTDGRVIDDVPPPDNLHENSAHRTQQVIAESKNCALTHNAARKAASQGAKSLPYVG
jgi:hypothetical protein